MSAFVMEKKIQEKNRISEYMNDKIRGGKGFISK